VAKQFVAKMILQFLNGRRHPSGVYWQYCQTDISSPFGQLGVPFRIAMNNDADRFLKAAVGISYELSRNFHRTLLLTFEGRKEY
jgi:hypothetical protein